MGATFDPKFNLQFGISHIVLPLIIGFGFSVLVARSWLAVLSVGRGLFRDQRGLEYLKDVVESNRRRFDRTSRLGFMIANCPMRS